MPQKSKPEKKLTTLPGVSLTHRLSEMSRKVIRSSDNCEASDSACILAQLHLPLPSVYHVAVTPANPVVRPAAESITPDEAEPRDGLACREEGEVGVDEEEEDSAIACANPGLH